jgi:hypothetical protein
VTSRKGVTECGRAAGARWSRRGPVNFNVDVEDAGEDHDFVGREGEGGRLVSAHCESDS